MSPLPFRVYVCRSCLPGKVVGPSRGLDGMRRRGPVRSGADYKDYYRAGVAKDAQRKTSNRRTVPARKYHPDTNPDDPVPRTNQGGQ